ncbi:secretion protein HlyD [Aerolutibacter ruishenii]|uniref:HlyD family secretion protein n=1 Tax=Aerolutibacter ruishenii TaxID=686800 RepID=A0A562LYY4_9GAMM|nr:secretion protein HlyD [Lysobacter ruishenii]TWI12772.1 HlyD family secretion protein [Lysobacter ruishenii]
MSTNRISPTRKRVIAISAAVVVVLAVAVVLFKRAGDDNGALVLYGNVDIREVQLAFRQPGRVKEMAFEEGDAVTAGDRVALLDAKPYEDALAAANAAVRVAEAEVGKLHGGLRPQEITQAREALNRARAVAMDAGRNYERQAGLLPSGAISKSMIDAARAARDQSVANVRAAEAALSQAVEGFRSEDIAAGEARLAAAEATRDQALTALADTQLIAPANGTIIARIREPGSMVANQSAVYSLSLDRPVYVRAYVGETDLGRVAPGTPVRVRNDSSSKAYRGKIGFVSPRAEFTPKTVETPDLRTDLVYRLRVVIDDDQVDGGLRQGMPVTVEVDAAPGSDAPRKGAR